MIQREPLMTEEHFEKLITSNQQDAEEIHDVLQNDPERYKKLHSAFFDLYVDYKDIAFSKYSLGYDVAEIKNDVENSIKWFVKYEQHPDHDTFYFDLIDVYGDVLQLYALGILLKIDRGLMLSLLLVIGNEGADTFFDTIAKFIQHDRAVGAKLLFPGTYKQLWEVTQNNNYSEQTGHMERFLKGWYKSMKKMYWHDRHTSAGKSSFSGYWCVEAALVTVLFNIDDSSYMDMPFYPKDMVAFAKTDTN
jgi:hypothetical protein